MTIEMSYETTHDFTILQIYKRKPNIKYINKQQPLKFWNRTRDEYRR